MEPITVRQATPQDLAILVQFQLAMALETESRQLCQDTVTPGVRAVFEDPRKGTYFLASMGEEIIGCLLTVPEWSDWRNGTVLWIHSLYVRSEFRRLGAFRKLYQHLRQIVETTPEYQGLRLFVYRDNLAAHEVYRRLGMNDEHYLLFQWMREE